MRTFLAGFLFALLALAGIGYLIVTRGWLPAGADHPPGPIERWSAMRALHTAIDRESRQLRDPLPTTEASLLAGAQVYQSNCLVCHGAADGLPSAIARGLNIPPPQLAQHGVEDDPEGETYWKVEHGIRFTGMPSYGGSLTEQQIWQVTQFLAQMKMLPPNVAKVWKAMPSAAK